ncbi:Crp/Fnr family transcriptional regulator [Variovorax sp. J22P271]|uniref:Crp/Fnr family transcriptional regulator n=1 Tax=Variovorax davisae TaxID=3053515 RepID=UPI002575373E|nr:Crp/Fnr family transcriptional regulator [Variovorax sp. J22P271]MDM0035719.1 Crp/Fnr family transcriptional regulator [Variovorax sp. J22P271]
MARVDNQLIELLSRGDRRKLISAGDTFELNLSDVLSEPGDVTRYAYFPIDGFVSLLKTIENRPGLEVGMVGREGMVGVQVALGVSSTPLQAVVQGQGIALRIGVGALEAQLADSPDLRRVLNRYVYVLMTQLATSAACLRHHHVGPRLARWLLMTQDRARSDHFRVTQEFLHVGRSPSRHHRGRAGAAARRTYRVHEGRTHGASAPRIGKDGLQLLRLGPACLLGSFRLGKPAFIFVTMCVGEQRQVRTRAMVDL